MEVIGSKERGFGLEKRVVVQVVGRGTGLKRITLLRKLKRKRGFRQLWRLRRLLLLLAILVIIVGVIIAQLMPSPVVYPIEVSVFSNGNHHEPLSHAWMFRDGDMMAGSAPKWPEDIADELNLIPIGDDFQILML